MAYHLSRRQLVAGGALAAAGAAVALRPVDRSGRRNPYFVKLQGALFRAGIATPTLVVDRSRLDANVAALKRDLPPGMAYRIVAKSLPSLKLLERVRAGTGTHRLMVFNLQTLQSLARDMADADLFLGKPLPIQAAKSFFAQSNGSATFDRIHWLIDTPERLTQFADLAKSQGGPLNVALELDVGLHRGGMVPGEELAAALNAIKGNSHLRFTALMGYEPHIAKLPTLFGWRDRELASAWKIYQDAQDQVKLVLGTQSLDRAIRNAAGSPTYRLYKDTKIANEVSVGSALVKPTDFDTELLSIHRPAAFIATPVIKGTYDTHLPGMTLVSQVQALWDRNASKTIFIYGGHWLAIPEDPPGLQFNDIFGRSSNQEMLNGGAKLVINPDEFIFFRPTQSEAVFLQFGDIAVYDSGEIVDRWPVFPASA